jgi:O-antigen ligase
MRDEVDSGSRGASLRILLVGVALAGAAGVVVAAGGVVWLTLALICLMTAVVTAPRPELAASTMMIGLPLIGSAALLTAPGIPDVTAGRVLILWCVVVVFSAIGPQRRQLGPVSREVRHGSMRDALPAWVAAFVALMLLAAVRSPVFRGGLQDWLDDYLLPFAVLLVFLRYRWSQRQIDLVVAVYMACCCLWSGLALVEFVTKRSLFTSDGVLPWASAGVPVGRTGGAFINPAFLGTAVGIGLVLAWVWVGRTGLPRRVAFACGPMCAIGLTVTLTRASWLGAAVGITVLLALTKRRRLATALIAVSALALCIVVIASLLGASFLETRTFSRSEAFNRVIAQRAAVRIIANNPLLGVGSNRFSTLAAQDLSNVGTISAGYGLGVGAPHNSILGTSVDGGIGAAACLVVVFGLLLARCKRSLANPPTRYLSVAALACIAVLLVNAMFVDMALGFSVTTLALGIIGILLSTANDSRTTSR